MPREMREDSTKTFRVVIERTHSDGSSYKIYYGPYNRLSNAKGVLTTELGWMRRYTTSVGFMSVEGWIEQTAYEWVRVEN